ncbi:MAG: glycosyltransferase family 2 protein [Acidobacteriota bacterium]|nr:glycosyltransferase family 2 protein [Acidobacteriota bacterium]
MNAGDKVQVSFGGKVDFFREFFRKSFLNAVRSRSLARDSRRRETSWVSGAFMLARRSALEDAGLFDEGFFLYFEDIDLCLRAGEKGWKVVYLPRAKAFHEGGATTLPRGLQSRWEYRRSQLRFYGRHCGPVSRRLLRSYLRLGAWSLRVRGLFDGEAARWGPRFSALLKKGAAKT